MRYKDQIHEHYKTKVCTNFSKNGYCKYGDRCLFLHSGKNEDKDRTRSNSPNEPSTPFKVSNKHQQNLKMLAEFGFGVFEAYLHFYLGI